MYFYMEGGGELSSYISFKEIIRFFFQVSSHQYYSNTPSSKNEGRNLTEIQSHKTRQSLMYRGSLMPGMQRRWEERKMRI